MCGCAGAPWLGTKGAAAALRWFHVDGAACWAVPCVLPFVLFEIEIVFRVLHPKLELVWLHLGAPTDTCRARSSVKSSEIVL